MAIIIADACANHNGKRELMSEMVKQASKAGVDVIKFQSFKANRLRKDWPDYKKAFGYYKQRQLSDEDHYFLLKECQANKIEFLTTVFDLDTVDFLARLGISRVKIGSADCNNWGLIRKCLDNFQHVIISTGMHSMSEVKDLEKYLGNDKDRVTAMHCVSLYPTSPDKVNLMRIAMLMQMFPSVGFSDHSRGNDACKVAIALGVAAVEKHFTLNRRMEGKDQKMSATVAELASLTKWRDKVQTLMFAGEGMPDKEARVYIGKWSGA